jgi:transcriptional regulator with XRE-family HTH domain
MAAAGAALTSIGTGGGLSVEHVRRNADRLHHGAATVEVVEVPNFRSPIEDLVRIREVLKPAVSDLAGTLNVSRQSVYNWLNGEPVAEENAAKLQDLARAADVLAHEGISVTPTLLKRKFAQGKTLLQVAQAGGSARDAAMRLAQIHKSEAAQRERINARFANRPKSRETADFDLPPPNDLI